MTRPSPTRSRRSTLAPTQREQRTVQQNIELMRVGLTFAAAMRDSFNDDRPSGRSWVFALMFVLNCPTRRSCDRDHDTRARPLMVALGASLALTVQMTIAVGAGSLLTLFPVHWKDLIVGCSSSRAACTCSSCPSPKKRQGRREAALEKVTRVGKRSPRRHRDLHRRVR